MSQSFLSSVEEIPLTDITIPAQRQRKNAKADHTLISSIEQRGLLQPILVRDDGSLIAGERRLDAHRQLGLPTILARRSTKELTTEEIHLIELQENIAREDLKWQDRTRAVADYHNMKVASFAGWTQDGTASAIGYSVGQISNMLAVARFLDDPDVAGCTTFVGALNLINNRAERNLAAAEARGLLSAETVAAARVPKSATKEEAEDIILQNILSGQDTDSLLLKKLEAGAAAEQALQQASTEHSSDERIVCADFLEWITTYTGEPFDVIHCDFPYGKDYAGSRTRKSGKVTTLPTYLDSKDIYVNLVDAFLEGIDKISLPSAHCIFWFDMLYYQWTVDAFTAAGWKLVQPFPLVWNKVSKGVAADTNRRPRHVYETALMFSRGDRRIRKLVADVFTHVPDDEKLHISQKALPVLEHFLSLVVDKHSRVLDPTCGSGTALAAAVKLGATDILGLELDAINADLARMILQRET